MRAKKCFVERTISRQVYPLRNYHFTYLDFEPTAVFTSSFAENAKATTDIEVTPRTTIRNLISPPTQTSIMEEFEDSDDEDEESFLLSGVSDTLIESKSGPQEFSLALDENTTAFSADSDNLDEAGRSSARGPESAGTSVDVPLHGMFVQRDAAPEDSISSSKTRIQVRDVAYTTYRAMLYYASSHLHTDLVSFNLLYVDLYGHHCIRPTFVIFPVFSAGDKYQARIYTFPPIGSM